MSTAGKRPAPARRLAHAVLLRVARDGAYADRALGAALERSRLASRDRHLATELVYGTLRQAIYLDFVIVQLTNRPLRKISPPVLAALRLGAYQLLNTRVPPHAAVNDSVQIVREQRPRATGLVNAVLRKVVTLNDRGDLPRPNADSALETLSIETSHPLWVVKEVAQMRQPDGLRAWLLANNRRPALWLRVNRLRSERARLVSSLHEHPHQVRETELCPEGLAVVGGGAVSELPGFAQGYFTIQDIAAQLIGRLADVHEGQLVLDTCAAPGGKATHLAEQMGDCGTILAVDIHPAKTRLIQANASRLGLESVVCRTADATDRRAMENLLSEHRREHVDLAIVDAPCSGLGTLRRHPELRIRPPPAIDELCSAQRRLLDTTADLVRPGGVLVYSVCTVTRAEGPDQILSFLDRHTDFAVEPPSDQRLQSLIGTYKHLSGFIQTWTDLHDADSFFAIRLRKSGNFA